MLPIDDYYGRCKLTPCECMKNGVEPSRMCKHWVSISEIIGKAVECPADLVKYMTLIREKTELASGEERSS